ncbi:hypothetical protein Z043_103897, partial [Scleropages formosus]
ATLTERSPFIEKPTDLPSRLGRVVWIRVPELPVVDPDGLDWHGRSGEGGRETGAGGRTDNAASGSKASQCLTVRRAGQYTGDMVIFLSKSLRSLLSVFKKKGEYGNASLRQLLLSVNRYFAFSGGGSGTKREHRVQVTSEARMRFPPRRRNEARYCSAGHEDPISYLSTYALHCEQIRELCGTASKPEDDRRLTVHFQSSPHYQENVFIEGSRPRYLEVLHSEAQEGLKILQQEEKQNGLDAESVSSTTTLGPGGGACQRERRGSLGSRSTTGDTASTASTRPALARQGCDCFSHFFPPCSTLKRTNSNKLKRTGSTFKPPNPVRRPEKLRRRSRRTTIMGIPHHVQKELGLERGVMLQPKMDGKVSNGGEGLPGIVVIPTIDGEVPTANHGGARVHLQNIELLQSSKEEQLLKHHIQQVYQEDVEICPANMRRPKSLAVPGLTTGGFLAEPQGPVMSISPQATYLSTIIPNAILPAAVDVIEINRSRSQSSVRTVGKSSLSASPASSRCAAARGPSSNRSHSQSSETVISNSSTISSKCSAQVPNGTEKDAEHGGPLASDRVSLCSATSWLSSASASTKQQAEMAPHGGREMNDGESQRSDGSFIRCLSVTKTKMPPAPPKRTYSLHQDKLKQRSQEILETDSNDSGVSSGKMSGVSGAKYSNAEEEALTQNLSASAGSPTDSTNSCSLDDSRSSVTSSALMSDQTVTPDSAPGSSESSPQKLPSRGNKFERTLSPSSGYSSQSGTPTLSAKEIHPPSPGNKKAKPTKPERMGSQASPAASISSSLTSLSSSVSETVHQDAQVNGQPSNIPKASPHSAVGADKVSSASRKVTLREELDIPPPPKVRAPFPPPPEIWMHNKRTFDLLCGSRAAATRLTMPQTRHPKAPSQDQKQETVNVDAPKVAGVSPPPSPPPAYHPPPPPSKNGLTASVSSSLLEDNQLNTTVESCWPPPPPPIEESPTPVFEEQDELDFPPPPPPEAPPPPPTVHNEILTAPAVIFPPALPTHVPLAPPLPEEKKTSAIFKRQPGNMNWESKSKDLEPWNRSSPVPKEDANIPLVTPSLLQMVRLRSVNVSDDQTANPAEDREMGNGSSPSEGQSQTQAGSQSVPQKPVRKSLSLKSPGPSGAAPSLRLQEAIRMKTAAMTSKDALPARLSLRSPLSSNSGGESGVFSSKPSEGGDVHKSPASTASFIFSRSTKKVVIETPTSPEAQSSLKQSLVAELMQVSDTANLAVADSKPSAMAKRPSKVPPPVARKPGQVSNNQSKLASQSEKVESSPTEMPASAANVQSKRVQPAGQNAHPEDSKEATSSTEAANTVEAQPTSRRSSGSARTDQSEL